MSDASTPNLPPRPDTYPGGTMPDNSIGGQVPSAQGGGTARLLDAATGALVTTVMDNEVPLFQYVDGNWYYRFDGVPAGSYRVVVNIAGTQTTLSTGMVSPGTEGNVLTT